MDNSCELPTSSTVMAGIPESTDPASTGDGRHIYVIVELLRLRAMAGGPACTGRDNQDGHKDRKKSAAIFES